jgi:hypothetical protein
MLCAYSIHTDRSQHYAVHAVLKYEYARNLLWHMDSVTFSDL